MNRWRIILGKIYRLGKRTRARTIRHTFSLATVAVMSLVAMALVSSQTSSIRLATPERTVAAGETFFVDVYVDAKESVNAVDLTISVPTNHVEVTGITTGQSVISIWTEDPRVEDNQVILRGGTFRRGFIGEHLIARLEVEAQVAGRAEFAVGEHTLLAGDGAGTEIAGTDASTRVAVTVGEAGQLAADLAMNFRTDIDGDGSVNLGDVQRFMQAWGSNETRYDFNNDGRINFTDFAIILADSFFN